jgi:hypothetical protein
MEEEALRFLMSHESMPSQNIKTSSIHFFWSEVLRLPSRFHLLIPHVCLPRIVLYMIP